MLKTYLYIPDDLEKRIKQAAKSRNNSKAELMRQALREGLTALDKQGGGGAEVLLRIAQLGRKYNVKGPRDLSVNHDYYLWGGTKRNPRV